MDKKSWAAGFIDGEGSLTISSRKSGSGRRYHFPALVIQIRLDDESAIWDVIDAIGIKPYVTYRRASKRTWNTKPTIQVSWQSKKQLRVVCNFLDSYPLRTKKSKEYRYWRQAVMLFINGGRSHDYCQFRECEILKLYDEIRNVRTYKVSEVIINRKASAF